MPNLKPIQFILPDIFSACPFQSGLSNPHYNEASAASSAWANSYDIFTERQRVQFNMSSGDLLASRCYPHASLEKLRLGCDFCNVLFILDDMSDDEDHQGVMHMGEVWIRAMVDENWDDGSELARFSRDFYTRLIEIASPLCAARLVRACKSTIEAATEEAGYRDRDEVLDVDVYTKLRRLNSGVYPSFVIIEAVLGIELSEEVFNHPILTRVCQSANDLIWLANDIYSYNVEQDRGHYGFNIISTLMKQGMDLQAAMDEAGVRFVQGVEQFLADRACMPSWGPDIDPVVSSYVEGVAQWVVGNLDYSFDTERYFGTSRKEVKKTRIVTLLPGTWS